MQLIESFVFILTIAGLGFLIRHESMKRNHMISLVVSLMLFFTIHVILEQSRWQLYPLYLAMLLILGMSVDIIFKLKEFQKNKIIRRINISIVGLLILLFGISNIVFPVYQMETPSGTYPVGTTSYVLTDSSRTDIYGEEGNRRIKVQFWYPADSTEGYDLVPWIEDGNIVAQALAKDFGLPSFMLNHTEQILSHSYSSAPISKDDGAFPVIVLSHGWRGFRNLHTDLAEELASLGYIVVGIDHTSGSVATVFGDNDIAYLNLDALPDRDKTDDFLGLANTLVNTYASDITLTIDHLQKMNTGDISSLFEGKLDLGNIGLLGHSTGAGAGVAVAINDERIKAVIGMDAWVEPIYDGEIDKGINTPALFIRSEAWETGYNNTDLYRFIDESTETAVLYQIDGTTHYDFAMAYMISPLSSVLNITGTLEGATLVSILEGMIVSFFDEHLTSSNNVDINNLDELWEEVQKIK